ncbi:hypothetical protein MNEG_16234, partial [Monoraphidium neglectum]
TALNVHALCTLYQHHDEEMGAVIFWQYTASLVTVPMFLALFLHICQVYF